MNYLTMRQFGHYGRWGNQIFQYAFLKMYAAKHNLELQLPPWVGNVLFGANDPPVTVNLPSRLEQTNKFQQAFPPKGEEYVNKDFQGYAQYHTSYYAAGDCISPHYVASWFQPTAKVRQRFSEPRKRLAKMGHSFIGLHLRRGDYGRLSFYVTPVSWYLDWLREHWKRWIKPVLFIATESPQLVQEFAQFRPVTTADLGVDLSGLPMENYPYLGRDLREREPWQMDFFPDWYFLSRCDVVLAPNSTFSITAAMMGLCQELWRSSLPQQKFIKEDPWNMYPLTHDQAEDYRHVPGICLDETPYWRRRPDGRFEELR